jgi:hypothetical protein
LIGLLWAATALGCATNYFENAATGSTASITVTMSEVPESFLFFRNGADCSKPVFFSMAQQAAFADEAAPPLQVEANKEIAVFVDARSRAPLRYCSLYISFLPEPGGKYKLQYLREGPNCILRLNKIVVAPNGSEELTPEPSFKRRAEARHVLYGENRCVPL